MADFDVYAKSRAMGFVARNPRIPIYLTLPELGMDQPTDGEIMGGTREKKQRSSSRSFTTYEFR